jgi:hypothetical protein
MYNYLTKKQANEEYRMCNYYTKKRAKQIVKYV